MNVKPVATAIVLGLTLLLALACEQAATPEPKIIVVTATPYPVEQTILATATPKPTPTRRVTPTRRATPTPESDGLIIRRPTPTRKPTATVGPTPTPAPTPWEMSDADDICYRSPAIQRALMEALDINLCRAVTIGELFRLDDELRIHGITLHPQDLEGLVNLRHLDLNDVNLQYQNFQSIPSLISLQLIRPVNYKHLELGHLTKLQALRIETPNAECTLLKQGFIRQLLGELKNLQEVYFRGLLYMPYSEQDYDSVRRQIQTEVLRATSSPLKRDDIHVSIELYDPDDYPDAIPPCSDGH